MVARTSATFQFQTLPVPRKAGRRRGGENSLQSFHRGCSFTLEVAPAPYTPPSLSPRRTSLSAPTGQSAFGGHVNHRLSRRRFLQIGALGAGGLTLRATPAGRGSRGPPVLAEIGDPDLPGRRAAASGHVRPEAQRAQGNRRPLAADRDQRARASRSARRFPAWRGSWTSWSSSAPWSATRPTTTPSRCSTAAIPRKPTASGGLAAIRLRVAKVQGPVDPAMPPFISLCYTCTHGPYNEPGPGFLGSIVRPLPPDGPGAGRHGAARRHGGSAGRPHRPC